MEETGNSEVESLGQMQPEDAAQQGGTFLQKAFVSTKRENKVLAAENAVLKEKLAREELTWKQKKKKLLKERGSLVSTLVMTIDDINDLVKDLESLRARLKQFDTKRKKIEKKMKEKEEVVCFLNKQLYLQQIETEKFKQQVKAKCDKISKMESLFKKTIIDLNVDWGRRWIVLEEEVAAELKLLQDDCEIMRHIIQEKDEEISSARTEIIVLEDKVQENVAMLNTAKAQIHQWQTKFTALEDLLRCERAEKLDTCKKMEELQNQSRKMEEKWLAKEQDWIHKESKTKEEIELLIQQNIKLQETALKCDKEKAKMKREEEKAKRDAEKRMKEEQKEREKAYQKEKKEREKKEKEREKKEKGKDE